ncbi:hypothetical protein COP2_018398 [Malus domestica]
MAPPQNSALRRRFRRPQAAFQTRRFGQQIGGGSIRRAVMRGPVLPRLGGPARRVQRLHRGPGPNSPPDLLHRRLRRQRR